MFKTRITFANTGLAAHVAGDPSCPALVLLHGWPTSADIYDPVIDALGKDYFTLAFDLPGIGGSHMAAPCGEKTVIADIVLSAAEAAGARSIIVAGFDVGGMIAFSAARDHGHRIVGAAVINTVIPGVEPWSHVVADPRIWHFAFHNIRRLPEAVVAGRERVYFDYFFDVLAGNPNAISGELRAKFAAAYSRPEALKAGFDWYRAFEQDAERNARPKRISKPIRYLRGDADAAAIDSYVSGLRAAGAQRVTSGVIPHSGEFPPLEAPPAFVRAMRAFRARCAGPVKQRSRSLPDFKVIH